MLSFVNLVFGKWEHKQKCTSLYSGEKENTETGGNEVSEEKSAADLSSIVAALRRKEASKSKLESVSTKVQGSNPKMKETVESHPVLATIPKKCASNLVPNGVCSVASSKVPDPETSLLETPDTSVKITVECHDDAADDVTNDETNDVINDVTDDTITSDVDPFTESSSRKVSKCVNHCKEVESPIFVNVCDDEISTILNPCQLNNGVFDGLDNMQLVANQNSSHLLSNQNSVQLSANHNLTQLSTNHNSTQLSANHNSIQQSANHNSTQLSANHNSIQLSANHHSAQLSAKHISTLLSANHNSIQLATNHNSTLISANQSQLCSDSSNYDIYSNSSGCSVLDAGSLIAIDHETNVDCNVHRKKPLDKNCVMQRPQFPQIFTSSKDF